MINLFQKIKLYFNTIKFLDNKQVFYYVYNNIKKKIYIRKRVIDFSNFTINDSRKKKIYFIKNGIKINSKNSEFTFLNKSKKINLNQNWNPIKTDKLWLYNLHYFDYILSSQFKNNKNYGISLIEKWIYANKFNYGNGWEPYTISLRIVNWIKFFLTYDIKPNYKIKKSLIEQALYLEKNKEYHLLANHLIANIKALIFFNLFFKSNNSSNALDTYLKLIIHQYNKQILKDGFHCEQSPYYHSTVLNDLIDIINICKIYKKSFVINNNLVPQMISSLKNTTHPNGFLANFNDNQHVRNYFYKELENYYLTTIQKTNLPKKKYKYNFNESGFYKYKSKNIYLICFFGSIACNYQPGHSHANTLSFEMSYKKNIIFRNPGISTYNSNSQRLKERSSSNYNMLQLSNYNSNEIWKSFRVGRRAKVYDFDISNDNSEFKICASHNGYSKFGVIHNRTIKVKGATMEIVDKINGKSNETSLIRFYLNYDISLKKIDTKSVKLYLSNRIFALVKSTHDIKYKLVNQNLGFNKTTKTLLLYIIINNNIENNFYVKFY